MLTEKETTAAYEHIIEILSSTGFDWVAAQVDEQVRFGLEEKKHVSVKGDFLDDAGDWVPGKRASQVTFAATREFTARERLELLLDAVEHAGVNAPLMSQELIDLLRQIELPSSGLLVHLGLEERRSQIEESTARLASEQANRLRGLINLIRQEM